MGYSRDNDFELDPDEFIKGSRVEVKQKEGWVKGTVMESPKDNERALAIKLDEKVHDNLKYYDGHGHTIWVFCRKRSEILKQVRYFKEQTDE